MGAHVPTRGRLSSAIDATLQIGGEAVQTFVSNPRAWAPPRRASAEREEFIARREAAGLGPVIVHASYLVNIASPDAAFRCRSVDLAGAELQEAAAIGADALVVHAGAGGDLPRESACELAAGSVREILADAEGPELLLELTAGGAGTVASTIDEAADLLDLLGRPPRVGLCLDTCHLFAAGVPLDSPGGVAEAFERLRRRGLARGLRVVHANDAKDPRGSKRDRHEHIGEGGIGETGFRAILADPAIRRAAIIVETPGGLEAHARNVDRLRRLAFTPTRRS